LVGRLASLNRFISRSTERNLPFFEILKLAEVFEWGPAQQKAFEELKQYLVDLTTLTPPVNHLGPFGDVLVINDNCLWTNDSWRNKNAGLDHIEQEMLENHKHWLWIK
jgi:hypothetical protein